MNTGVGLTSHPPHCAQMDKVTSGPLFITSPNVSEHNETIIDKYEPPIHIFKKAVTKNNIEKKIGFLRLISLSRFPGKLPIILSANDHYQYHIIVYIVICHVGTC